MDPRLFALIFYEAVREAPDGATLRELLPFYNELVTPENALTWRDLKSLIGQTEVVSTTNPDAKVSAYISRATAGARIRALNAELSPFLKDVNQELFDAMVRHQIYLLRLSGTVRNNAFDLLDKTHQDIAKKLKERLGRYQGLETPGAVRQLQYMEKYIKTVRAGAWGEIGSDWVKDMADLAKQEATTLAGIVSTVAPVVMDTLIPSASFLTKIANTNPFEGRTLKEWAKAQADVDVRRILNAVRVGMVQGDPIDVIVARVGQMNDLSRTNVQAIVRTAVNFFGHAAREEFIKANQELFSGERYVATLDSRTTPFCRAHDGRIYPVGVGPRPPTHWNCRSIRVPVLDGEALGQRPARNFTEKQLLREFAEENGLGRVGSRDSLPYGFKGQFDAFVRQRIRDLTTRVPSATSYQSWLENQSRQFQDDILGPTRARLFRSGKLSLDKFIARDGSELTLKQLARQHAEAFKAAGLDPEDFL